VRVAKRFDPLSREDIVSAVHKAESHLGKTGRVLLRASGTEPLIRVMTEGQDASEINRIAEELAAVVENSRS
jgi:phosphoglucosamine mutase